MRTLYLSQSKSGLIVIFSFLCFVLYIGCRKQDEYQINRTRAPFTLREAMTFFRDTLTALSDLERKGNGIAAVSRSPLWRYAHIREFGSGLQVLIVPLQFSIPTWLKVLNGKKFIPVSQLTELWIYKDTAHRLHAEVVTYVPDDKWFLNISDGYQGIVYVKDWRENFVKGFYCTSDGEIMYIH